MPSDELKEAVRDLSQFFSLFTLKDLIGASITNDKEAQRQAMETGRALDAIDSQGPVGFFSELILDAQTGVNFSKDIIARYVAFVEGLSEADIKEIVGLNLFNTFDILHKLPDGSNSVKSLLGGVEGINDSPDAPSKENPSLSVVYINTSRITPSTRNANAASLFMNAIPTIEFSKCVPFLDIQFQLFRPAIDTSGRPQTLSLTRFLEGGAKIDDASADYSMHTGIPVGTSDARIDELRDLGIDPSGYNGFGGMGIFTSPQTLVNADPNNSDEVRVAPIIDKFRPLWSIQDFSVSVVATTGIMCYKTAKLEIVLHDRSRLYEVADFIKPDMAGDHNSEILIEYGWSHPEGQNAVNPYGPLLNSMRKKEKYHIRNSSFAIKDNGEVTISLELYMKGALDFYNSSITDGGEVQEAQKAVADIQKRIADLRARVYKQDSSHMKEIRGVQILNAAQDQTSQLQLSKEMKKELKAAVRQLKDTPSPDAKALLGALQDLYGKDAGGEKGAARDLLTKLSNELQRRMRLIQGGGGTKRTFDPFLFDIRNALSFSEVEEKEKFSSFVSFGKLATIFIGQPLAASKQFDEVQLLFYPMNSGAGFARNLNTAQFYIEISRFQEKFNKIKDLRRTNNLTVRDFIQFVGTTFFDDPAALAYGMRKLFSYEDKKETGTKTKPKGELAKNPAALSHERDKIMEAAGVPNGTFKMPQLDVYVETVPAASTDGEDNTKTVNDNRTILRVHFFDRRATSYESLGELLRATRDEDILSIRPPPPPEDKSATNDHDKIAQQMYDAAIKVGLLKDTTEDDSLPPKSAVEIQGGPQKLKDFIRNSMPSITYGQNNTAVISAGFKTLHDPRLSSVVMLRSGDSSPLTATGVGQGGLPLWMRPGQMDMQIIGCPIIEFAQGFFVDFQTNTSIDNIYHVTKLDHTIKQGEFKTTMTLIPFDAYGQYRALKDRVAGAIALANKLTAEEANDS